MPTATEQHFTVEYFAEEIRQAAPRWTDIRLLGLEYVKVFAKDDSRDTAEDIQRIRNILAAVEIVRAEQAGAE